MSTQSYENHAHQPVFTIVTAAFWAVGVIGFAAAWAGRPWGLTVGAVGLLLAMFCLISITRVYTTRLQDRIIVLEEQLRAERLLSPAQLAHWRALGVKQVAALRFASDAEFPALLDRIATESLKPDAIKRAVRQWRADWRRT
jgi:hypothetical protein